MTYSKVCISATQLTRAYRTIKRDEGFLGSVKSFFWRKWVEKAAVKQLSFRINEGECVGFLGPNGAGKTTLLKMLSGILVPSSGSCTVLGFVPHKRSREFRKSIAFVTGQRSQLVWDLPPMDTFEFHRDLYSIEPKKWKETLDILTHLLQVAHVLQTPTRQLSLGERMKCELILSLLHQPKVLFLDEPTIGVDAVSQRHIWEFLREYQKQAGITTLLTSHSIADIEQLCSRVLVMSRGRRIYDGTLNELATIFEPEHTITLRLHESPTPEMRMALERTALHVNETDPCFLQCRVRHVDTPAFLSFAQRNLVLADWDVSATDFGDILSRTYSSSAEHLTIAQLQTSSAKKLKWLNGN